MGSLFFGVWFCCPPFPIPCSLFFCCLLPAVAIPYSLSFVSDALVEESAVGFAWPACPSIFLFSPVIPRGLGLGLLLFF